MDISMDVFIKIKVYTLLQHSYFKTFNRLLFLIDFWEKVGKRSGIYTEMRTLMGVLIEAVIGAYFNFFCLVFRLKNWTFIWSYHKLLLSLHPEFE